MRFYMAPPQLDEFEIALSLFLFVQGRRNDRGDGIKKERRWKIVSIIE